MAEPDVFNLLGSLTTASGGGVTIQADNPLTLDLGAKWINRTLAVGIAKQIRSNLLKGLDPNGVAMPPLKHTDILTARTTERYSKLRGKRKTLIRGIETGELMRSIVSASIGQDAEVFVKGDRGQAHGNNPPASVTTFVLKSGTNLFTIENLEQKYIKAALDKIAQRIVDQQVVAEMEDVLGTLK